MATASGSPPSKAFRGEFLAAISGLTAVVGFIITLASVQVAFHRWIGPSMGPGLTGGVTLPPPTPGQKALPVALAFGAFLVGVFGLVLGLRADWKYGHEAFVREFLNGVGAILAASLAILFLTA